MGRNATINIQNNTGYDLILIGQKIEHGKFQAGGNPPEKIISNNSFS